MRLRRTVVLALVAFTVIATAAAGAPRSGAATDPYDSLAPLGSQFPDVKKVGVTYDPSDGRTTVVLELHEPLGTVLAPGAAVDVWLDLAIGGLAADGRTCSASTHGGHTGDLRVSIFFWAYGPIEEAWIHYRSSVTVTGYTGLLESQDGSLSADRRTIAFHLPVHDVIAGRDHRCVTGIGLSSNYDYWWIDEVAPFWFEGFAPPAVGDSAAPVVTWQSPFDGQAISGVWQEAGVSGRHACRIGASDDVAVTRVEVFLDGRFLNEELYAPWACVIDTRTLPNGPHRLRAVAYDAAGRSGEATITVLVDNDPAAPPLPDPPAPPAPPLPSPLAPIVIVTPPAAAPPAPVLAPPAPVLAPPVRAAADRRAPRAATWRPARSLRALVGGGMVVPFACDEACTARARLVIAPRAARALGIARLIGSSRVASGAARTRALAWVRLRPAAKRALRSRTAVRATLTLTLSDAAGNRRVQRRTVLLRR